MLIFKDYEDHKINGISPTFKQFSKVFKDLLPHRGKHWLKHHLVIYNNKYMLSQPLPTFKQELERFRQYIIKQYQIKDLPDETLDNCSINNTNDNNKLQE